MSHTRITILTLFLCTYLPDVPGLPFSKPFSQSYMLPSSVDCFHIWYGRRGRPVNMSHLKETTLTFFLIYLSPLTSEICLLVKISLKLYDCFVLQWIALGMKRRTRGRRMQERQLLLSSICTYLP